MNTIFQRTILYFPLLLLFLVLGSCANKKKYIYFQQDVSQVAQPSLKKEKVYRTDDLLEIVVNSSNREATVPFNVVVNRMQGGDVESNAGRTYLINAAGEIYFPILGKIEVKGLTRAEAIDKIQNLLVAYLDKPVVDIRLKNFRVTVLGDVGQPGTFVIPQENLTLPEVIGMAGDLNITGKRAEIKLIREENGARKEYLIDLTDSQLFASPAFYLQQNDILYVRQNQTKMNSALYSPVYTIIFSATAVLVSLINTFAN